VFTLVHLTPGDPAAVILGPDATSEEVAQLRREMGFDEPFFVQFFLWFGNVLRGDLGRSYYLDQPVAHALLARAQPTVLLMVYSLTIAILIGVPAGIISAIKRNSLVDRLVMMLAISGVAIPNFVLGIFLIMIFAVFLGWLPSGQYTSPFVDLGEHFRRMIMPSFALGFSSAALLARLVRSSMLDVLQEDYVRTAFAKGVAFRNVITRHALRNALIPAVTVIGYSVGALLGGAVVTETVFAWPGMGKLLIDSINLLDRPVIVAYLLLIVFMFIIINLLVDIAYTYLNPKIEYR
jgi:peptide/nickel transport system permease protein